MITAAIDESMLDSRSWKGIMRFNLGSVVPYDLSNIFKASSFELKEGADEVFNGLYEGIVSTISNQERVNEVNTVPFPSSLPLSDGKTTHVFLGHDWGVEGKNHGLVKQVGEALKTRNLKVWIDDGVDESGKKRIRTQLDEDIARAIDETECMLVFITKNYLNKVNGNDLSDYCQKEFKYGFDRLQKRVIPIIVDSDVWKDIGNEKKTLNALGGRIGLNLSGFIYHALSRISDSSTLAPKESLSKNIECYWIVSRTYCSK